ncbi:MAG: prepilin-type N-terminal cleavage/methylation domain-containing protein [Planctomycetes bacterium]|nr:prepilin-type N-terminal cleavage/methylation domain-containing protein [Planctomycetota bacterium]
MNGDVKIKRVFGFSLIELTVVLLIIAIAAAAVTLRVQQPMRLAQMREVLERMEQFDRLTRTYAREHDKAVWVELDLSTGRLSQMDESESGRATGQAFKLPKGYTICKLKFPGQDVSAGKAAVVYSRGGLGATYAMLLEDPQRRRRWVLCTGLGGQVLQFDDEREIRDILDAVAAGRNAG